MLAGVMPNVTLPTIAAHRADGQTDTSITVQLSSQLILPFLQCSTTGYRLLYNLPVPG
jgi:hypothetical protein